MHYLLDVGRACCHLIMRWAALRSLRSVLALYCRWQHLRVVVAVCCGRLTMGGSSAGAPLLWQHMRRSLVL
jgi:hypothetical protein